MNGIHVKNSVIRMMRYVQKLMTTISRYHNELFAARYRREILRDARDRDDLFLFLTFSEFLGIPNPTFYYTLELLPYLLDEYHEWHKRQGMERSPLDSIRCC